jgi:hypothetical protein
MPRSAERELYRLREHGRLDAEPRGVFAPPDRTKRREMDRPGPVVPIGDDHQATIPPLSKDSEDRGDKLMHIEMVPYPVMIVVPTESLVARLEVMHKRAYYAASDNGTALVSEN